MSLLNKLFPASGRGLASGGKKTGEKKPIKAKKASPVKKEQVKPEEPVKAKSKISEFPAHGRGLASGGKSDGILVSSLATEKAVSPQTFNKYFF